MIAIGRDNARKHHRGTFDRPFCWIGVRTLLNRLTRHISMNPSRRSAWITSHFHRKYAIVRMHRHYIFVTRISRYSSKLTNPRFTGLHPASLNGFAKEFRIATLVHTFVTRTYILTRRIWNLYGLVVASAYIYVVIRRSYNPRVICYAQMYHIQLDTFV